MNPDIAVAWNTVLGQPVPTFTGPAPDGQVAWKDLKIQATPGSIEIYREGSRWLNFLRPLEFHLSDPSEGLDLLVRYDSAQDPQGRVRFLALRRAGPGGVLGSLFAVFFPSERKVNSRLITAAQDFLASARGALGSDRIPLEQFSVNAMRMQMATGSWTRERESSRAGT